MICRRLDAVYLAVPDLEAACRPYERLGLCLAPARQGRRTLQVGGPSELFTMNILADAGWETPLIGPLRHALAAGRGLFVVALDVEDVAAAVAHLAGHRIAATTFHGGSMAWVPMRGQAGTDVVLVRHPTSRAERCADVERAGLANHSLTLRRLDHLAVVTPDLDVKTRFWTDIMKVPVAGEVVNPAMVIRQLRIGDAVIELLGPASPDSPIWKRPPGLVSMASWQVDDLEMAVLQCRSVGFSVPDPVTGVLPGTRVATIPGTELAGVNLQLLEYR